MKKKILITMALVGVIILGYSAQAPAPYLPPEPDCAVFTYFDFTVDGTSIEDGRCILHFTFQAQSDVPGLMVNYSFDLEPIGGGSVITVSGDFPADGEPHSGSADLGPACECTYGLSGTAQLVSGATALMSVEPTPSVCDECVGYGIGYNCINFSSPVPIDCYDDTPPIGDEGCTPGYWKNIKKHGDEWTSYSPETLFVDVFGVVINGKDSLTLEDALRMGGGGIKKLARHGTAALLSAAHPGVEYPLTVEEVIDAVRGVGVDADTLAEYNELGCPLN